MQRDEKTLKLETNTGNSFCVPSNSRRARDVAEGEKNLKFKSTFLHHFYAHFGRWIWMMFHPMMDWYLRAEVRGKSDHFIYNSRRFRTEPEIFLVPTLHSHFYVFLHLFVISVRRNFTTTGGDRMTTQVCWKECSGCILKIFFFWKSKIFNSFDAKKFYFQK